MYRLNDTVTNYNKFVMCPFILAHGQLMVGCKPQWDTFTPAYYINNIKVKVLCWLDCCKPVCPVSLSQRKRPYRSVSELPRVSFTNWPPLRFVFASFLSLLLPLPNPFPFPGLFCFPRPLGGDNAMSTNELLKTKMKVRIGQIIYYSYCLCLK